MSIRLELAVTLLVPFFLHASAILLWAAEGVAADMSGTLVESEYVAMQKLRVQLQVKDSAWEPQQDPCSYWRGVQCLNGHVDSILLTGLPRYSAKSNPLALQGVWALQQLPFLRVLNASHVTFSGGIPEWFGNVTSLESLDLSGCSLSGPLPLNFGNLVRLGSLSLDRKSVV